jgi:hypothetical protein
MTKTTLYTVTAHNTMATSGDSTNSILSRFTYQLLPGIVGILTYNSITLLANNLKANAACISTELEQSDILRTLQYYTTSTTAQD